MAGACSPAAYAAVSVCVPLDAGGHGGACGREHVFQIKFQVWPLTSALAVRAVRAASREWNRFSTDLDKRVPRTTSTGTWGLGSSGSDVSRRHSSPSLSFVWGRSARRRARCSDLRSPTHHSFFSVPAGGHGSASALQVRLFSGKPPNPIGGLFAQRALCALLLAWASDDHDIDHVPRAEAGFPEKNRRGILCDSATRDFRPGDDLLTSCLETTC